MLTQMMESSNSDVDDIEILNPKNILNVSEIDGKYQEISKHQSTIKNLFLKREIEQRHFTLLLLSKYVYEVYEKVNLRNWSEQQKYIFGQYVIRILAQSGYNHLALKKLFENCIARSKNQSVARKTLETDIFRNCKEFLSISYDAKQISAVVAKYFATKFYENVIKNRNK